MTKKHSVIASPVKVILKAMIKANFWTHILGGTFVNKREFIIVDSRKPTNLPFLDSDELVLAISHFALIFHDSQRA